MQQFEFVLKNEKRKLYDRFAVFVFILNGLAILYFLASTYQKTIEKNGLPVILLLLLTLVIYFLAPNKKRKETTFLFTAIGISLYWIWIGYWWLSLILVFLFFLYRVSKKELRVYIIADNIIYPSFPKRIIQWNELSNIVLKDGLLTIDFKNNKIIQQLIENTAPMVNEKEFNEFCKQQLRK